MIFNAGCLALFCDAMVDTSCLTEGTLYPQALKIIYHDVVILKAEK